MATPRSRRWYALSETDPAPGAYRPYVSARRPGEGPGGRPRYRVLVHREYLEDWKSLPRRVRLPNAQQFWDHVANTPGRPPRVGTSTVMKGKHNSPKWAGYSKTIHYEITGAGRIDYQYADATAEGGKGDVHAVVKILSIELGSH